MSKEAKQYLEDRSIEDIWIDSGDTEIHLSDVLHDYAKNYFKEHIQPKESIETRKTRFMGQVTSLSPKYSMELIGEFIEYWTEHNEGGKKMRFETHKIFNIDKRLGTWNRNNKKFNNKKDSNERYNVGTQDYTAKLADARPGL